MPINKLEKINADRLIGVWKITETENELIQSIDIQKDILDNISQTKALNKRLEWLASRVLIKQMGAELNLNYQGISKNTDGKPLLNKSTYELSITHSYPYVAAIIDKSKAVGIDLEQPKNKLLKVARKFCNDEELEYSNSNVNQLCILWSAKEALYKIYSKRGLIFKEHLLIDPFKLEPFGTITGYISVKEWRKSYNLHYSVTDDFVLVYNLN